jgi:hypothetical protein
MAIAAFVVMLLVVAAVVVYPLLPGRTAAFQLQPVSDAEIERAVGRLRRARSGGLRCPTCGEAYRADDQFCVRCGSALPGEAPAEVAVEQVCPTCGATRREGDVFCSKCGHRFGAGRSTVPESRGEGGETP